MPSMTVHHRGRILLLTLLLLTGGKLFAQLNAGFTASATSGCAPLVIHFTDTSKGNPTQWRWELGNGVSSSLKSPSSTYFNPGTYAIKLVVKAAGGADSIAKQDYITVYPSPVAQFKGLDSAGCFPLKVQFTDLSTTASGSISSRNWDFGDGTVSTAANPTHIYTAKGNFNVTLRVVNNFGCAKTLSKQQYIKIANGVKAGFTHNTAGQCKAPVTVQFKNTSTGATVYTWDFGDGEQSNETAPSHVYTKTGTYTVSLIAVNPGGCRDTIKKINLVSIGKVQSDFNVPKVCEDNLVSFSNATTPAPTSVLWSFGDGTTSTEINPAKTYSKSGTYSVKLVNYFGGCTDSITRQITVHPKPKPAFGADKTSFCGTPFTANFKNTTAGNNTYKWEFGDGGSSSEKQPSHVYKNAGTYTVKLIVFNENGCSDTLIRRNYIEIKKPVVTILGLPATGCNPVTARPTASIVSEHAIAAYLWNFGDGNTSTDAAPTYVYTKAGNYTVSLTVTTVNGCSETVTMPNAVRVGEKPKANFIADPLEVCAVNNVQFTDKSTGNVDEWFWNFGDNRFDSEQNPSHVFNGIGTFTVTLVARSNTCADTIVMKDLVKVKPPLSLFSVTNTCADKLTKTFKNESVGATRYEWDFGDGKTSTEKSPVHTFSKKGNYKVTLKVYSDDCWNTNWKTVKVLDEKADFTVSGDGICKGNSVQLTAQVNSSNISSVNWNFGDGNTGRGMSATHVYGQPGVYAVTLTVRDALGCITTGTKEIKVFGPVADFTPAAGSVCLSEGLVGFNDLSKADGTNVIAKHVWDFGDGSIDSSGTTSFEHTYTATGIYTVKLKVTDAFGCVDSITKVNAVVVAQPKAKFYSPDTLSCTNKPIRFINQSTGSDLKYKWSFGDNSNSNAKATIHQYSSVGKYTIGLTVTDQYGCTDAVVKEDYINISLPKAKFTVSDSVGTCPPLLVHFTNASSHYTSLEWDFGDGNTSTLENPSHFYTVSGVYYAKLIVTGPGGCTDSMSKKIEITGPRGSFTYEPLVGCQPVKVKFTAVTENRSSFVWDFSDGTIIASKDSVISHVYTESGTYIPRMILTDIAGCSVPIQGKDTIRVADVKASFTVDRSALCNEGVINFKNATVSNDLITGYQWTFGDGHTDTKQQVSHKYTKPGAYTAQLIVTTQSGCTDTTFTTTPLTVFEGPVINMSGDTEACMPAKISFKGNVLRGETSTLKWNWNFGNGQTSSLQNPSEQSFANAAEYGLSVVATDKNGCKDSVQKKINIHPLPATNAGADALVCRGNTLKLNATGAVRYVWKAAADLNCIDCPNPVASPAQTKTYTVTGYTAFGCQSADSVTLTVRQPFNLTVSKGDTICEGKTTLIWANGADKYSWSPAAGLDKVDLAKTRANPKETTTYVVTARDNDNCFEEKRTVTVKVNPLPSVEAGTDISLPIGTAVQLKTVHSNDVKEWQWTPGTGLNCTTCPEPKASPKQTTKYHVRVMTDGGCINTDEVNVSVICNNGNLFIPNTFSPNGDGSNERFYPRGTGIAMIRSLRIFNRWGELVYERINFNANDASAGWDGTFKGQKLTSDVYVYSCEVVCMNNEVLPFSGDVSLLR